MSTTTEAPEWVAEAVSLQAQGLSEREIAESVGRANSTVHAALKKVEDGVWTVASANGNGSTNGNGNGAAAAEHVEAAIENAVTPGQTTVEEQIAGGVGDDDFFDSEAAEGERPAAAVALEEEAGPAVGPMPPAAPAREATTVYVEEIRVDGTTQTALDVGGKRATTAECALSGKVTVDGSLRKGDVLTGTFRAVVRGAAVKDTVDKQTGVVTDAAEKFTAQLVDLVLG